LAALPATAALWFFPAPLGVVADVRRSIGWAALAWVGTLSAGAVAVGLGVVTGALIIDPGLSGFEATLGVDEASRAALRVSDLRTMALLQVVMIVGAPVLQAPLAMCEELGWRGVMVGRMASRGPWPAVFMGGGLWGLWVGPILLPSMPWLGLGVGLTYGVWLGWLRLRTGSIWPGVALRGALAGLVLVVPLLGEPGTSQLHGPLGWPGWVVAGTIGALVAWRVGWSASPPG
jgi:membrane protease YdiL (CAAX protease family)